MKKEFIDNFLEAVRGELESHLEDDIQIKMLLKAAHIITHMTTEMCAQIVEK